MHRSKARTWTLVAQCATAALVAVVAMVAVAGMPGLGPPRTELPPMPDPTILEIQGAESLMPDPIPVNPVIESLRNIPNAPKPPQREVEGTTPPGEETAQQPRSSIEFTGAVLSSGHSAAMLKAGEEKAWVAMGQSAELAGRSVHLIEVQSDYVRLAIDGAEQRLERAKRTGSSVGSLAQSDSRMGDVRGSRSRSIGDAREQMMRAPELDPMQARRNRAESLLERALEMEQTNPEAAERLRQQAERILSVTPNSGPAGGADQR